MKHFLKSMALPRRNLRQFGVNNHGVAMIEFVLVMPIIFLLLFGMLEVTRLLIFHQKLEKSVYALGDIITQYTPAPNATTFFSGNLTQAELRNNIFPQFSRLMAPFDDTNDQAIIVTALFADNRIKMDWQLGYDPSSTTPLGADATSIVNGVTASTAATFNPAIAGTLPTFPEPENTTIRRWTTSAPNFLPIRGMVVTEVFYRYRPVFRDLLQGLGGVSSGAGGFNFYLNERVYVKRNYMILRNGRMQYLPAGS